MERNIDIISFIINFDIAFKGKISNTLYIDFVELLQKTTNSILYFIKPTYGFTKRKISNNNLMLLYVDVLSNEISLSEWVSFLHTELKYFNF